MPMTTTAHRDAVENCEAKVHTFLKQILKIDDSHVKVRVDRAHRVGKFSANKTRPIVAKFKDTASKMVIKDVLRNANLRDTPYIVSEQYPPEVQQL